MNAISPPPPPLSPLVTEILIAEDSPAQARLLTFILEQHGYRVVHAGNGRQALEAARLRKPTLIISDILMPEMDGYQLSAAIKADVGLKDVPVILLTTLTDPNDIVRGLECGAETFILKPYDEVYLIGRVQSALVPRAPAAAETAGATEITYNGRKSVITAGREQILNLLLSVYDAGLQRNKQLSEAELALRAQNKLAEGANKRLQLEILERDKVEQALRVSQTELKHLNSNLDGLVGERTVELHESTRRYFTLLGNLPGVAFRSRPDRSRMEFVSEGSRELLGVAPGDLTGGHVSYGDLIHMDDRVRVEQAAHASLRPGERSECEYRVRHADGTWRRVWERSQGIYRDGGELLAIEGFVSDVTVRDGIERQLREVQRLEAVGRLTGGLAHDLNNYLAVIISNLDALAECKHVDLKAPRLIAGAIGGAVRSADLTRSLLAFSRRQMLRPAPTDIGRRVGDVAKRLGTTIGGNIKVSFSTSPDLWQVDIDGAQLDASIVNLAHNARDAMPTGGLLTIALRNVAAGGADGLAGDHVLIELTDTGSGMSPENLAQACEPFFSTKGPGHGTGMGLSMVHGFVHQSGGVMTLASIPDAGTTVRIFLPRMLVPDIALGADQPGDETTRSPVSESVLVVEDNEHVRATAVDQLQSLGYGVVEAANAAAALVLLEGGDPHIDLVFSDITMPGAIDGYELAERIAKRWPAKKVLLTSGFTDAFGEMSRPEAGFATLAKPYRKAQLARAVRVALDTVD